MSRSRLRIRSIRSNRRSTTKQRFHPISNGWSSPGNNWKTAAPWQITTFRKVWLNLFFAHSDIDFTDLFRIDITFGSSITRRSPSRSEFQRRQTKTSNDQYQYHGRWRRRLRIDRCRTNEWPQWALRLLHRRVSVDSFARKCIGDDQQMANGRALGLVLRSENQRFERDQSRASAKQQWHRLSSRKYRCARRRTIRRPMRVHTDVTERRSIDQVNLFSLHSIFSFSKSVV